MCQGEALLVDGGRPRLAARYPAVHPGHVDADGSKHLTGGGHQDEAGAAGDDKHGAPRAPTPLGPARRRVSSHCAYRFPPPQLERAKKALLAAPVSERSAFVNNYVPKKNRTSGWRTMWRSDHEAEIIVSACDYAALSGFRVTRR